MISDIKYRTNIEQLIGEYVALKRRGTTLVGLCPFHSEKTPSFTVWPQKNSFYCFGCGAGGDAITFVRKVENLDYPEAVRFLAKRAGVTIPEEQEDPESSRRRMRTLELNRFAARYFHAALLSPAGAEALAYLKNRGFTDKTITVFGMGYSPNSWTALTDAARKEGYTDAELTGAFLSGKHENRIFDLFRNRVIFPLIEPSGGGVVGFAGRRIHDADSDRKYFNTNDSPVFSKRRFLFGLNLAKKSKADHIIVVEGPIDCISLHQAGFDNAVASQGTALTEEHARLLARYTKKVMLCFDGDAAGSNAAQKVCNILQDAGLVVKIVAVTGAKDPDEYVKAFGAERFRALIEGSADATSFRIRAIIKKYDLSLPDQKIECLKELASLIATLGSDIEIDVYCDKVAKDTGVDASAVKAAVKERIRTKNKTRQRDELRRSVTPPRAADGRPSAPGDDILESLCRRIVRYAWDNPSDRERVQALLPNGSLPVEFWDRLLQYAAQTDGETDTGALGESLSVEEMGRVAEMQNADLPCAGMAEAGKYIEALKAELQRRAVEKDDADPGETERYLDTLRKQKGAAPDTRGV